MRVRALGAAAALGVLGSGEGLPPTAASYTTRDPLPQTAVEGDRAECSEMRQVVFRAAPASYLSLDGTCNQSIDIRPLFVEKVMKLCRISIVGALLTIACTTSGLAQSAPRSEVSMVPFAGWTAAGSAGSDFWGPLVGGELTWELGKVLWTPLEIGGQFAPRGGYVKLATGAALISDAGYFAGILVGVSRFSLDQPFLAFRMGTRLPLPLAPVLEFRLEGHDGPAEGGSALSITLRVPISVR